MDNFDLKQARKEESEQQKKDATNIIIFCVIVVVIVLFGSIIKKELSKPNVITEKGYCDMCHHERIVTRYSVWYMSDIKYESFNDDTNMKPKYDVKILFLCDSCKDELQYYNGKPVTKIEAG